MKAIDLPYNTETSEGRLAVALMRRNGWAALTNVTIAQRLAAALRAVINTTAFDYGVNDHREEAMRLLVEAAYIGTTIYGASSVAVWGFWNRPMGESVEESIAIAMEFLLADTRHTDAICEIGAAIKTWQDRANISAYPHISDMVLDQASQATCPCGELFELDHLDDDLNPLGGNPCPACAAKGVRPPPNPTMVNRIKD